MVPETPPLIWSVILSPDAWPEAVPTTLEIAERCDVEMQLGQLLLPRFPTP